MSNRYGQFPPWNPLTALGLPQSLPAQIVILRGMGFPIGQIGRLTGASRRCVRHVLNQARRQGRSSTPPDGLHPAGRSEALKQLLRRAILAWDHPRVLVTDHDCAALRTRIARFLADSAAETIPGETPTRKPDNEPLTAIGGTP